jgi:hypothetical protein
MCVQLRRIFGASVIAAVDREEVAGAAARRRAAAHARGRPGAAAALRRARRGMLATPKQHWPPLDGNLSMELVGESLTDAGMCVRPACCRHHVALRPTWCLQLAGMEH